MVSVGRLDLNSEGLLLLTNDGELARKLELPANGWLRRYRVRVNGFVDERVLAGLAQGITVEGVRYGPIEAGLDSRAGRQCLADGGDPRRQEPRGAPRHAAPEPQVSRLIRTAYGPFQLGALPRGAVEEVQPEGAARPARPEDRHPGAGAAAQVKAEARAEGSHAAPRAARAD